MSAQPAQQYPRIAPNPFDTSISSQIAHLRHLQHETRMKPMAGAFAPLRKLLYKIVYPAFSRQYKYNEATIEILESVSRELERQRLRRGQGPTSSAAAPATIALTSARPAQVNVVAAMSSGDSVSSAGQVQDQARLNNIRQLTGFASVYSAPAELRMPERVALYSLVFGLQPKNVLEIGTFRGGSTAIICGAMDDTGFGQISCIDPTPKVEPELWARLSHRCRMFEGLSPAILGEVYNAAGAPFDFAWIDGNHTYECLRDDIAGVLPLLDDHAYLLFHDAHYHGVKHAIDEAVASTPHLTDCGLMSVEPTVLNDNGQTQTWAGMRLLRFQR